MQISSASLLAAQQARTQPPAQPRASAAKPSESEGFEPLLFAAKPDVNASKPNSASLQSQATPASFTRPGAQIDLKV
jgi:hypothetical protein